LRERAENKVEKGKSSVATQKKKVKQTLEMSEGAASGESNIEVDIVWPSARRAQPEVSKAADEKKLLQESIVI